MQENVECLSLDIDGTLANIEDRKKYAETFGKEGSPKYWSVLLDGAHYWMDTLIPDSLSFVNAWLAERDDRIVVYVSGRRQGTEELTKEWLDKFGFPEGEIKHRPQGFQSLQWKAYEIGKLTKRFGKVAHLGDRDDDVDAAKDAGARPIKVAVNLWLTREEVEKNGYGDLITVFREPVEDEVREPIEENPF